jgi:hypothetical protein
MSAVLKITAPKLIVMIAGEINTNKKLLGLPFAAYLY